MLDSLFGEGPTAFKLLFGLIVVLGLVVPVVWAIRRFGGQRLGNSAARGRQPRLAVIDEAAVDARRRLILIRRDNVEHLLIIGGPTDVVIEQNIVRATGAPREAPPVRAPAAADAALRAVPPSEGSLWPLQPEPAPRPEPRPEPAPRPQRPAAEEPEQWPADPEPPPPVPPATLPRERARPRAVDPLTGLAEELARAPVSPEAEPVEPPARQAEQPPRPPPRRTARPQPAPPSPAAPAPTAEAEFSSAADQNLAEMAQRLEAALRRPATAEDRPPQSSARTISAEEPEAPEAAPPAAAPRPPRSDVARPARADARPAPQKSLYDSLEQEMASLLGRPNEKT
jgi:flagellar biogenesis protein FliO